MKILCVFILIMLMANPAFAGEDPAVEELKVLADKFSVCYGAYKGYSEVMKAREPLLSENFNNYANGAEMAALLLLSYASLSKNINTEGGKGLQFKKYNPYVKALGEEASLKMRTFLDADLLVEVKAMLDPCVAISPLQASILQELRKLMYDLP